MNTRTVILPKKKIFSKTDHLRSFAQKSPGDKSADWTAVVGDGGDKIEYDSHSICG